MREFRDFVKQLPDISPKFYEIQELGLETDRRKNIDDVGRDFIRKKEYFCYRNRVAVMEIWSCLIREQYDRDVWKRHLRKVTYFPKEYDHCIGIDLETVALNESVLSPEFSRRIFDFYSRKDVVILGKAPISIYIIAARSLTPFVNKLYCINDDGKVVLVFETMVSNAVKEFHRQIEEARNEKKKEI